MKFERLGNIADFVMGQAPHSDTYNNKGEGTLLIKAGDFSFHFPTPIEYTTNPISFSKKGDVLICVVGATSGKVNKGIDASITRSISAIRVHENKLNSDFLFYWLKSSYSRINKMSSGSAQGIISKPILAKLEIPYPNYSDQLFIANILSKAENLIAQRKESLLLLDEFLKNVFLEMFGDPVRNEKKWTISSIRNFGSLKNGLNYTKNEKGFGVRCLGVGDFKDLAKITDIESLQVLNLASLPSEEYYLKDNDLVFVRSNGNKELVGRCVLVFPKEEKITFSGFCIRYRIEDKGIDPVFLSHLFRVPIFRQAMLKNGKGANIQNINQQILENLKIPLPPNELQSQFAQSVEKIESLKTQYQQSLQELENLYGSLTQKAFKGELTLK